MYPFMYLRYCCEGNMNSLQTQTKDDRNIVVQNEICLSDFVHSIIVNIFKLKMAIADFYAVMAAKQTEINILST